MPYKLSGFLQEAKVMSWFFARGESEHRYSAWYFSEGVCSMVVQVVVSLGLAVCETNFVQDVFGTFN